MTCIWKYEDNDDYWKTACGNAFQLLEGTPAENGMRFCPYCGGGLTVAPLEDYRQRLREFELDDDAIL